MSDLLADYQSLLAQRSQAGSSDDTEELLQLMDPVSAEQLRLCAIPHQFNRDILKALVPDMTDDEANDRCEEFSSLSIILPTTEGWFLHDETRRELIDEWFTPKRAKEFAAASARMASYFEALTDRTRGEAQETARRRRMYHLVGADQKAGFEEFESLLSRARHQRRFSECASLIRLMHEYDSVLAPERSLWLAYFDGKLAADNMAWPVAEEIFRRIIAENSAPIKLHVNAYVQLGYIYKQQHDWKEAIYYFQLARQVATTDPASLQILPDILHDLGAAYRDLGDLSRAESLLGQSIDLATQEHNLPILATIYNSLGILNLKRRDNREAIEAFHKSLDYLNTGRDDFRSAQVFNNLGIAFRELRVWEESERFFEKSLQIKQQAGDSLGLATAMINLASVRANQNKLDEAIATTTKAIVIFEDMRDFYNLAIALQNRGKYFLRQKNDELAKQSFMEAIDSFERANKPNEAQSVKKDLEAINTKMGLLWSAWPVIVVVIFLVAIFLIYI